MRMERDALTGATSNPSIFEKAIGESNEYDAALKNFQSQARSRHNGDLRGPGLRGHSQRRGYAAPGLRSNTRGGRLHQPGMFALCRQRHRGHAEGSAAPLARRRSAQSDGQGPRDESRPAGDPRAHRARGSTSTSRCCSRSTSMSTSPTPTCPGSRICSKRAATCRKSRASRAFLSAASTPPSTELDAVTDDAKKQGAAQLKGKAAIANAKLAYALFKSLVAEPRWERLAKAGAKLQRLLWASTSTKNPDYRDTLYVEELVGRDTVNTLPPATLDAFRDHGVVTADAIERDLPQARADLAALADYGVSLDEVTTELTEDGVRLFADAFDKLLGAVAQRRLGLLDGPQPGFAIGMNSCAAQKRYEEELETWRKNGSIRRLWSGDASLWTSADEATMARLAAHRRLRARRRRRTRRLRRPHPATKLCRRAAPRHGRFEPRAGSFRRDLRAPAGMAEAARARQHRSGADRGNRSGARPRQDSGDRLVEIRRHARAEHSARLFLRAHRGPARTRAGRRAFRRRDRQGIVAGKARARNWVSRMSSSAMPRSAAAIRRCRVSVSSPPRRWGSTCGVCSRTPRL